MAQYDYDYINSLSFIREGNIMLEEGDMKSAETIFVTAMSLYPNELECHKAMYGLMIKKGQINRAKQFMSKTKKLFVRTDVWEPLNKAEVLKLHE